MNFLKSFIENTKTDNTVTLNDSSYNFRLLNILWRSSSRSSIICNTQFQTPSLQLNSPVQIDTEETILVQDPTYQDSQRLVFVLLAYSQCPCLSRARVVGGGRIYFDWCITHTDQHKKCNSTVSLQDLCRQFFYTSGNTWNGKQKTRNSQF